MRWFDSASANSTPDPLMVGPQTDGTNLISGTAVVVSPTDTAGGQPANYEQNVLDIFKFGVQAWSDSNARQQMFDYRKFEATNGGLFQQGRIAQMPAAAQAGGISGTVMMAAAAIVLVAILTHKG